MDLRIVSAWGLFAVLGFAKHPWRGERIGFGGTDQIAATAVDTATESYEVGGIRIIQRHNPANTAVVVHIYLLGGARQVTSATAGIEPLMLESSGHGTLHYPEGEALDALALTGSTIEVAAEMDWTTFELGTTTEELDSAWAVFADRLVHPTLDPAAVELVRARMLSARRLNSSRPDAVLDRLADSVAFTGHPYEVNPIGTERSLQSITPAEVKRYHADQVVKSRLLVLVVGNASRQHVERLIRERLAALPQGNYSWTLPPPVPVRDNSMTILPRRLPTNYIGGYYPGPLANSEDFPAFRLATELLSSMLYSEIRAERGLSYTAYSPFLELGASAGGVYASTTAPDKVFPLIASGMSDVFYARFAGFELRRFVEQFITEYYLRNETSAGQADYLARAELYRGGWRHANKFMEDLRAVSPADVRRVARKYMGHVQYVYVGDTTRMKQYMRQ